MTMRLVDSASGHHVWGESFEGDDDDQLSLQDRAVMGIVRAIPPNIRGAEIERVRGAPPEALDAHDLTMRALPFVCASRPAAARRALDLLHRAIEIDPDYGLATALAAWGHTQLVMYNGAAEPGEERAHAVQLVSRAEILDEEEPLALTAQCAVHMMTRDFAAAESLVVRALARDPSDAWTWGRSGWLHSYSGDSETALRHFGRALSLHPSRALRANCFAGVGSAHFNAGRYEAAASWLREVLREQPGMAWANRSLSVCYARMGDRPKALEALNALRRFSPDLTVGQVVAAVPFETDFLDRLGEGLSDLGLPLS
jgi:adenylate cyclase